MVNLENFYPLNSGILEAAKLPKPFGGLKIKHVIDLRSEKLNCNDFITENPIILPIRYERNPRSWHLQHRVVFEEALQQNAKSGQSNFTVWFAFTLIVIKVMLSLLSICNVLLCPKSSKKMQIISNYHIFNNVTQDLFKFFGVGLHRGPSDFQSFKRSCNLAN